MLVLLNAAPNTGNQGVSALCLSAVDGLTSRGAGPVSIADHGLGQRTETWELSDRAEEVTLFGLTHNRRFWRGDCLRRVHSAVRSGVALGGAAGLIRGADAVLDVSGGDSFTDLYGPKRFNAMVLTKRLALAAGRPLVLLPQTLGPFRDPANQAVATEILSTAAAVWVRDARSFAMLKTMLGDRFDPARHRFGVDMALLLPATRPNALSPELAAWLSPDRAFPVAGLNVSGLLCSDPDSARAQFGLAAPHTQQIDAAARALLASDPELRLVLLSHVLRPSGDPESDHDAATALKARLGPGLAHRVMVLPQAFTATELKWVIGRLDWFAGARMHATIAGLSSGVPTLGLGYSDKSEGVFAACGFGEHVADLRLWSPREIGEAVASSFAQRGATRAKLRRELPWVRARAEQQMSHIAALCARQTSRRVAA